MIVGRTVYLTSLDPEDAETVREWINDPEVREWMLAGHVPISKAKEREFFEQAHVTTDAYHFEIRRLDDRRLIGICGLQRVDMLHRHAEFGIFIGDIGSQGKGFGADAIRTLIGFAFGTLGLHTVQISYLEGNERAAKLYPKLGFKDAGRLREYYYIRGEFRDAVLLDMTREEYDALAEEWDADSRASAS